MEKFQIQRFVTDVIDKIEQNGYEAWLVGGCVRDMLRGVKPNDYDIASSAPCEAICGMFDRVIETGIKHGTVTVISGGMPIEVTRYRIDGDYADHRRPDSVEFTRDFRADLSRRDFTVNAIGYSPKKGIFDPFGGEKDITAKILRTVGDPEKRFDEDALRIMRAVRFASTLGFEIEKNTLSAAKKLAPTLKNVSAERIFSELMKTLKGDRPELTEILIDNGGLVHIGLEKCDDLSPLKKIVTSDDASARLAALIKLCGADARKVMSKLKSDGKTKSTVVKMNEMLVADLMLDRISLKKHMGRLGKDRLTELLSAHSVIFGSDYEKARKTVCEIDAGNEPLTVAQLDINGTELQEMGFSGKEIGEALDFLLEKVLENPRLNKKDILKELIVRH